MSTVTGTTICSRALARSKYSNWPLQVDVIAGREIDLGGHRLLRLGDIAAEIAVAQIDEDIERELRVLGADARGALRQADLGHLAERHRAAARQRDQHFGGDVFADRCGSRAGSGC